MTDPDVAGPRAPAIRWRTGLTEDEQRRIRSLIAVRGSEHGSGLGRTRFVVERTHSWFGHFRRIVQCYERQETHFLGMQQLAACVICARRVKYGRQPAEGFQPFAQAA